MKEPSIETRMTDLNLTLRSLLPAAAVLLCVLHRVHGRPQVSPANDTAPPAYKESPANAPQKSPAPPATTSTDPTLGGLGGLDRGPTPGCLAARQMVGDLQRS